MVSDRHGLPLCVKDRFIRRGPYAVQVLYILLSVQSDTQSVGVNVISRPRDHHVGCKNLLVAAGHFQVAVAVIRHEKKTMARVVCPSDQIPDGFVSLSDVVLTHFSLGHPYRILSLVLVRRLLGILRTRWIAPALEIVTNGARTDLIHNDAAHLRCQLRSVKRGVRASSPAAR